MRALAIVLALAQSLARAEGENAQAKRHYFDAQALTARGQWAEALEEFRQSFALSGLPVILYFEAECLEKLERFDEAQAAVERFLALDPSSPRRQNGEELRARVTEKLAAPPPAPAPPASSEPPPPVAAAPPPAVVEPAREPPRRSRALLSGGVALGVLAVAAAASGIGLSAAVASAFPSRQTECRARPCVPSDWADLSARQNASYAMYALAGAAALADAIVWVVYARKPRPAARVSAAGVTIAF